MLWICLAEGDRTYNIPILRDVQLLPDNFGPTGDGSLGDGGNSQRMRGQHEGCDEGATIQDGIGTEILVRRHDPDVGSSEKTIIFR